MLRNASALLVMQGMRTCRNQNIRPTCFAGELELDKQSEGGRQQANIVCEFGRKRRLVALVGITPKLCYTFKGGLIQFNPSPDSVRLVSTGDIQRDDSSNKEPPVFGPAPIIIFRHLRRSLLRWHGIDHIWPFVAQLQLAAMVFLTALRTREGLAVHEAQRPA